MLTLSLSPFTTSPGNPLRQAVTEISDSGLDGPAADTDFRGKISASCTKILRHLRHAGDVDIRISPSAFGLRFLITYSSMYNSVAIFEENTQVQFNCYFCRIYRLSILNYTNI